MFQKNVMVGSWQEPTEKKTCVLGTLLSSPTINCTPLVPPTSSQVKDVICSGLHPASRGQALKHVSPRLRNVQEVSGCPFAWHWMNFIKSYYVLPLSEVETPSVKAKPLKKLYCNPIPPAGCLPLGERMVPLHSCWCPGGRAGSKKTPASPAIRVATWTAPL